MKLPGKQERLWIRRERRMVAQYLRAQASLNDDPKVRRALRECAKFIRGMS